VKILSALVLVSLLFVPGYAAAVEKAPAKKATVTIPETSEDPDYKWIVPPTEKGGRVFDETDLMNTIFRAFEKCGGKTVACMPIFEKEVKESDRLVNGNARLRVCQTAFDKRRKKWSVGAWSGLDRTVKKGGLMIFCNVTRPEPVAVTATSTHTVPKDEVPMPAEPEGLSEDEVVGRSVIPDTTVTSSGPIGIAFTAELHEQTGYLTDGEVSRSTLLTDPYSGFGLGLRYALGSDWSVGVQLTVDRAKLNTPLGLAPLYWGVQGLVMTRLYGELLGGFYARGAWGFNSDRPGLRSSVYAAGLRLEYVFSVGTMFDIRPFLSGGIGAESDRGYVSHDTHVPERSSPMVEGHLGVVAAIKF
jgi:hypothetical protein